MKTCAYIFFAFALAGIVWAQSTDDLYDVGSEDSAFVVKNKRGSSSGDRYASDDFGGMAPTSVDGKIELIERQITILTSCYNKMRSALQSVARKMPSQTATSVAASSLESNKEVLVVLNTLSDRVRVLERAIERMSSQVTTGGVSREDNKEVLVVLDTLSRRMTSLESGMEKLSSQASLGVSGTDRSKEMMMALDSMSERTSRVENAMVKVSAQVGDVSRQLADSKAAGAVGSTGSDAESAILGREILVVVKEMSRRIEKLESAGSAVPSVSSTVGMEDKLLSLDSAVRELSLQVKSMASQKSLETQGVTVESPVVSDKLSSLENAVGALSKQVGDLAVQRSSETSVSSSSGGSSDSSIMNREAMILFKVMSEKLDKIEGAIASGAKGGAVAVPDEKLVSIVGAVISPGKVKVDDTGKKDLLMAISEVGGFKPSADKATVTVRRGPKVFTIDVDRIMNENLLSFMLEGKDIVVVKERDEKKVVAPLAPQSSVSNATYQTVSDVGPRIQSAPGASSQDTLPELQLKPKMSPQTGGVLPRGADGGQSVLQKELTALQFE